MEAVAREMLENDPRYVQMRGWKFVGRESRTSYALGATRYIAVYVRPYDPDLDPERFAVVVNGYVQVSTRSRNSLSWREAYRHAIESMKLADSMHGTPRSTANGTSAPAMSRREAAAD